MTLASLAELNNNSSAASSALASYIRNTTPTRPKVSLARISKDSDYSSGDENRLTPGDLLANALAAKQYETSRIFHMSPPNPSQPPKHRVYKVVLTGGPCGGKTTGQVRLATFFEQMGWKVFTVPEAATILLGAGVKFVELNDDQRYAFQKDLLRTLIQIESVFFNQASLIRDKNVLVICDRGAMDPSAYLDPEGWGRILKDCKLDPFELRENRYNQVVHMVTAADGAEEYYTLLNNSSRSEGLEQAIAQDRMTRNAWIGHPYVDIIDNTGCSKFDDKILKLLQVVCDRAGVEYQDRLNKNSRKRKWLVRSFNAALFPKYEEFEVTHDYLLSESDKLQVRIRERCQNNKSMYTITTRHFDKAVPVETRMQITEREYNRYLSMRDSTRSTLHKRRRCFNYGNQYYQMDIFVDPLPPAAGSHPLIILETYTVAPIGTEMDMPKCVEIVREITDDPTFSMYNLAKIGAKKLVS